MAAPDPQPTRADPAADAGSLLAAEPGTGAAVRNVELKARLLLLLTALLVAGATLYLLYARGVFEPTQRLVLLTDDSEGVSVGMDMTFSGFPIGRVRRVELAEGGSVRIIIDVARKDAHWLRTGSVFTLVRGLVGGTTIRAFTGVHTDPPLPDGAERPVLRGDATAELPRVIAAARETLENLTAITAPDSSLRNTLANVQATTERLNGPQGALGVLLGQEDNSRKLLTALDRTNALLARLDQLTARVDGIAGKADVQVFGAPGGNAGLLPEARAAVAQLTGLLADTRASLRKVDAVLAEAQAVGANVRGATADLDQLRGEVDANLRKVESLINDINRRWPFGREPEVKLP